MEPILIIVSILIAMIIGLLIFNSKFKVDMQTMAWSITAIALGSMLLLVLMYPLHPECNDMINHNNVTLQALQNTCYQYINL
jgi:hypothetical protein